VGSGIEVVSGQSEVQINLCLECVGGRGGGVLFTEFSQREGVHCRAKQGQWNVEGSEKWSLANFRPIISLKGPLILTLGQSSWPSKILDSYFCS
jgi:hypothetical protein